MRMHCQKCLATLICVVSVLLGCSVVALVDSVITEFGGANAASSLASTELLVRRSGTLDHAAAGPEIVDDSAAIDDSTDVDIGNVVQGDPIQHVFAIRNATRQTMTIVSIQKSCACQQLELAEGTKVPAGKVVKFTYATPSIPGRQLAKAVVKTDSTGNTQQEITFQLRANVGPAIGNPPLAQYGLTRPKQSSVSVVNQF